MIFNVPKMSCGHCTAAITKAITTADPTATVTCDLTDHTVTVQGALDDRQLAALITSAGYDSTLQVA